MKEVLFACYSNGDLISSERAETNAIPIEVQDDDGRTFVLSDVAQLGKRWVCVFEAAG